jgi:hypothetical protein
MTHALPRPPRAASPPYKGGAGPNHRRGVSSQLNHAPVTSCALPTSTYLTAIQSAAVRAAPVWGRGPGRLRACREAGYRPLT